MLSRENFNKHGDFIGHLNGLSHPINYKKLNRTYNIYPLIYNKIISDLKPTKGYSHSFFRVFQYNAFR